MKYKAVIFDLDGTAVPAQPNGTPSDRLINTLKSKKGALYFSCATGRVWTFSKYSETIGVGDGLNDLHLFSGVGYKIAMGNAVPELQARADRIIDTLEHDGLAAYIEELTTEYV